MRTEYFNKLVERLKKEKLDAILISPSEELIFILGKSPRICERFQGLFIKNDGEYFYVCNLLTADEMKEVLGDDKVYSWFDGEDYTEIVKTVLTHKGLLGATIAVNSTAQPCCLCDISEATGIRFTSGKAVLEGIREIKTPQEMENMRASCAVTDAVFAELLTVIKPGMTEGDLKLRVLPELFAKHGGLMVPGTGIVASGPNTGYAHYNKTDRVIQKKDTITFDIGCVHKEMRSDMTRTIFIGGISEKEKEIYQLVLEANLAGEKAAVEGAYIPDIDKAARDVIEKAGYGKYFTTRLGHGIGYMVHESPDIKQSNKRYLEKGMAFTIEPGIYIPGDVGCRIEDTLLISEKGTEILFKTTKDIIIL